MEEYSVYSIKEKIALYFFHKSEILGRFIKTSRLNMNNDDLKKQFNYITTEFSKTQLINHIQKNLLQQMNIIIHNDYIVMNKDGEFLTLYIYQNHLTFYCETLSEAELLLFPILRTYNPYLFVVGNKYNNYGWIRPISKNYLNNNSQILYSYQ